MAGKADWAAAALPLEGKGMAAPHALEHARNDIPICSIEERVRDVRTRVREAGWNIAMVLNAQRIVLGLVEIESELPDDAQIGDVMDPGPSTYRPSITLEELEGALKSSHKERAVITTLDGVYIGIIQRLEAEKTLRQPAGASAGMNQS